jgi:putative transposase
LREHYLETFIGRFGDELLKRCVFAELVEAKALVEDYRGHYNHCRPHSTLRYQTRAEFVAVAVLDGKVEASGKPKEL